MSKKTLLKIAKKLKFGDELVKILNAFTEGGFKEEALDSDDVADLSLILKAELELMNGNITNEEYNEMLDTSNDTAFLKVGMIYAGDIPSDVLERIADYEEFSDNTPNGANVGEKIYAVDKLHQILTDKEDDTNATTKHRIEKLYKKVKAFDYFMVTKA